MERAAARENVAGEPFQESRIRIICGADHLQEGQEIRRNNLSSLTPGPPVKVSGRLSLVLMRI